jgi:hypothetical protein
LFLYDLSQSGTMTSLGSGSDGEFIVGPPSAVAVRGDYAYSVSSHYGVTIADISDPLQARAVGSYPIPYGASGIVATDTQLLIAAGSGGLLAGPLHQPCPTENGGSVPDVVSQSAGAKLATSAPGKAAVPLRLRQPIPNPFNPSSTLQFELPRAARVSLKLYDAAGRVVRTLLGAEWMEAGLQAISWDGLDDAGRAVASGVFYVQLEAEGVAQRSKLVLVK